MGRINYTIYEMENNPNVPNHQPVYIEPFPVRLYHGLLIWLVNHKIPAWSTSSWQISSQQDAAWVGIHIKVVEPMGKPTFPPGKHGKTNKHCGQLQDQWIGLRQNLPSGELT